MKIALFPLFLLATSAFAADSKMDPRIRDEDISSASLVAKAERAGGDYRYSYTLTSPANSVGTVRWFMVDVGCRNYANISPDRVFGSPGVPFNYSMDGRQVDARLRIIDEPNFDAGVTARNEAKFVLGMPRGATRRVEIISESKPGYRHFYFNASTIENRRLYDYSNVDESEFDDPEIPSAEDWEVHGLVIGPACSGQEATPLTRPVFDGQPMRNETRAINGLLKFEIKGNRNRFHAPASQTDVKLKVYYGYEIDKTTFSATINGRDISSLFSPNPGATEDVTIPLEGSRSLINVSVYKNGARNEEGQLNPMLRDLDPFEIRRPMP